VRVLNCHQSADFPVCSNSLTTTASDYSNGRLRFRRCCGLERPRSGSHSKFRLWTSEPAAYSRREWL